MTMATKVSVPDNMAQQHSDQLLALIKDEIARAGGKINFAQYMHLCLYTPGLGYYSAGSNKLGTGGDFTTAPEISSLFSQTLAHHIKDVFSQLEQPNILEFGAGSGKMAVDILLELERLQLLPQNYFIIEASADLRLRQQKQVEENIPHLSHLVQWLDQLPKKFSGVVLANEVCDAMPVHCLHFNNGQAKERYIGQVDGELSWLEAEISSPELFQYCEAITPLIGDFELFTEVNLAAKAWLASLADSLKQGAIFIIDYGHNQASYYHPQREKGTLMCYYQHQAHDNPLLLAGLQDITAHVDFTSLAQTALDNNLDIVSFQSQADFLLAGGITELIPDHEQCDELTYIQLATEIKQLTHPSAMGETFKTLTLSLNLDEALIRSQLGDRRYKL